MYHRHVESPPQEAVSNGQCNMGTFSGPIPDVNLLDAKRPLGLPLPKFFRSYRMREWEAVQLSNDEWFLCVVAYDAKIMAIGCVIACNRKTGAFYLYKEKGPTWRVASPNGLKDSHATYTSKKLTIDIHNNLDKGTVHVTFDARNFKGLPPCSGTFTGKHDSEPIVIVQPFGDNRPLYSHKALIQTKGALDMNGAVSEFEEQATSMIIDDHKGFYPFTMGYDWVTGLGIDEAGIRCGFNLTDNQVVDHHRYNENCLWYDGAMIPLPPIHVQRPDGVKAPWVIQDTHSLVDLKFTPMHHVDDTMKVGPLYSFYHAPVGRLEGTIASPDGKVKAIFDGFWGMGEKIAIRA